jgi:hypothetical protein
VAFLEIVDGVDVVLMPDQHAALEGDVHEALSDSGRWWATRTSPTGDGLPLL